MIWPMLCIGIALLPGQINFISEGIKAEQLMWPLLLALMVGLTRQTLPMVVALAVIISALHPVAAPILAACGMAAVVIALLRTADRLPLLGAGAVLIMAGVYRFVGVNSGYEQSEMTWETQSRQWGNGASGLPAVALVAVAFIALTILLQPWIPSPVKQRLDLAQLVAIMVSMVALVIWAARPSNWWEALEYRGPAFWVSMVAAGCLFLHVVLRETGKSRSMQLPKPQMVAIAIGFSVVISVQSVAWKSVLNDLDSQLAGLSQACLAREDVAEFPFSPLNLWTTNPLTLVMQGDNPDRISMTTEQCHHANQTGDVFLSDSSRNHVDRYIDVSAIRASLPEATTCTWQETTGWHQPEALIPDSWRWSDGTGVLDVTMHEPGTVLFRGEFRTLEAPNTIRVIVNGAEIDAFDVEGLGSEPFATIPLQLPEGATTVSFVSDNPPTTLPNDGRPLAMSVWNLTIRPDDGSSPCLKIVDPT